MQHNNLTKSECQIFGEGLKENHSIMGIHMLGNDADVDPLGFVNTDNTRKESKSHVYCRIKPGLDTGAIQNTRLLDLKASSNCWICEGWSEVLFKYKPGVSDNDAEHDMYVPIWVHLESDQYQPDLMLPDPMDPEVYISRRMVPPGLLKYYFSIGEGDSAALVAAAD